MERFILNSGQCIRAHKAGDCIEPCTLHSPSNHHMVTWMLIWREDAGILERLCPHGIGHPDPDMLNFFRRKLGKDEVHPGEIHGCDGCCQPESEKSDEESKEEDRDKAGDSP